MRGPDWPASVLSGVGATAWLPRRGPLIMMYHGIGGEDGVSVDAFEHHLAALTRRRRVVPLLEAVERLGRPESGELAAVTFDDGYRDFAELAMPVLRARGLHATVFVPAGWLGKTSAWEAGRAPREILTGGELRRLDPASVTVGAHGLTHTRLAGMSAAQLEAETRAARRLLEDACGRAVTLYAYPHGQRDDFDAAAENAVEAAGFTAACSTKFGRGSRLADRFRLRRIGVEPGDSLARVEQKLDGGYDWVALKEALGAFRRRGPWRGGVGVWNIRSSTR